MELSDVRKLNEPRPNDSPLYSSDNRPIPIKEESAACEDQIKPTSKSINEVEDFTFCVSGILNHQLPSQVSEIKPELDCDIETTEAEIEPNYEPLPLEVSMTTSDDGLHSKSHSHRPATKDLPKKKLQCSVCSYETLRTDCLRQHELTHCETKQFKCLHCSYATNFINLLKHHLGVHNEVKEFKCSKCDYATNHKYNFKRHISKHSEEKPFSCPHCSYCTSVKNNLYKHSFKHREKNLKCDQCSYSTSMKRYLKQHMLKHSENDEFFLHLNTHGSQASSSNKNEFVKRVPKKYKCTTCEFATHLKDSLKKHMSLHLKHKEYKCEKCTYMTDVWLYMKQHRITHIEKEKLNCTKCDFSTNLQKRLNNHMLVHEEKHLKCDECAYKTNYINNLKRHKLAHIKGTVRHLKRF